MWSSILKVYLYDDNIGFIDDIYTQREMWWNHSGHVVLMVLDTFLCCVLHMVVADNFVLYFLLQDIKTKR